MCNLFYYIILKLPNYLTTVYIQIVNYLKIGKDSTSYIEFFAQIAIFDDLIDLDNVVDDVVDVVTLSKNLFH